jgi:site-specific DNA recombinase
MLIDKGILRRVLLKDGPPSSFTLPPRTDLPAAGNLVCLDFAARLRRVGAEVRFIVAPNSAEAMPSRQCQALVKAIARAYDWREQLINGLASGPRSIAKQTGLDESYVRRILGLAFLAPDIVEVILKGRQPENLTLEKLRSRLPMGWAEQRQILFSSSC